MEQYLEYLDLSVNYIRRLLTSETQSLLLIVFWLKDRKDYTEDEHFLNQIEQRLQMLPLEENSDGDVQQDERKLKNGKTDGCRQPLSWLCSG